MTNMPDALTVLVLGAEQSFLMFCLLLGRVKRACGIRTARLLQLSYLPGTLAPGNLSFQACGRFSVNSRCLSQFGAPRWKSHTERKDYEQGTPGPL